MFAKVFGPDYDQILVTKDSDDDKEQMAFTFELPGGGRVSVAISYDEEAERDRRFDAITAEQVQETVANLKQSFGLAGFEGEEDAAAQ